MRIKCGVCQEIVEKAVTRRIRFQLVGHRHPGRFSACLTCAKGLAAANSIHPIGELGDRRIILGSFRVELGQFGKRDGDDV